MAFKMNINFKHLVVIILVTLLASCGYDSQYISTVSFSNNLLDKIENISVDCKQTKGSDIPNSKCFYQLALITEIYSDAITKGNSIQLEKVLVKIDAVSSDIYTRNQQYLSEQKSQTE